MNIIFSCCSFICENHFPEILEVTVVQSGFSNCTKLLVLLCVYVCMCKCSKMWQLNFWDFLAFIFIFPSPYSLFNFDFWFPVLEEPWLLSFSSSRSWPASASSDLTVDLLLSLAFGLGNILYFSCCSQMGIQHFPINTYWLVEQFSFSHTDANSM